jgi:molybdopterin/thiamine biosynthesis adenylyltransferase
MNLYDRIREIVNPDVLENKRVVAFGLGSGGSITVLELAKCGVGNFVLVDPDHLDLSNIVRHVCGLNDLGRNKADAMRDEILNRNCNASVRAHAFDIMEDYQRTADLMRGADLVLAGTDNEPSKHRINLISLEAGVPVIYAAAFHRAFCGEVFRVIPGQTPCYACFAHSLGRTETIENTDRSKLRYDDPEMEHALSTSPGLGMDIAAIALIASKLALMTLVEGTRWAMPPLPGNYIFWGNRPLDNGLVTQYWERKFWQIQRNPQCLICSVAGSNIEENLYEEIMTGLNGAA